MKLYISPPSKTNWGFDIDRLLDDLSSAQAPLVLRDLRDKPAGNILEWSESEEGAAEVYILRDGQTVVVDGPIEECARWAVWLRARTPVRQALVYYDEGYSADGVLSASTAAADIVALFSTA